MQKLIITQPDDWHCHLRDGEYLTTTVNATARACARAIVMPNLKTPVTTVDAAKHYRQKILQALTPGVMFEPLMTLYLTDNMPVNTILEAKQTDYIKACKLYPAGATTNSNLGVTAIEKINAVLAMMEEQQMPLLIHGEVTDPAIDIFDREKIFIETKLIPLQKKFPKLPIVLEHITTKDAVEYVMSAPSNIAATITVHHLLFHRNALFQGGIRPDYYCLPILKRQLHQQALISAATSGNSKFFIGTDSAPHAQSQKYTACGCAGLYTAHAAIELYTLVFEQQHCLNKLEGFLSHHGADFYQLPRNKNQIILEKKPWQVPAYYAYGKEKLTPLWAGETLEWQARSVKD